MFKNKLQYFVHELFNNSPVSDGLRYTLVVS